MLSLHRRRTKYRVWVCIGAYCVTIKAGSTLNRRRTRAPPPAQSIEESQSLFRVLRAKISILEISSVYLGYNRKNTAVQETQVCNKSQVNCKS